jgi:predicted secreted hydrolase
MSADFKPSRRALAGSLALLGLTGKRSLAQGFAGLGDNANGYRQVTPGRTFSFPSDHGPHPDFRIEWWYITANLTDARGAAYGAQWTLFRQAMAPAPQREGWANQQIWMAHGAVTGADTHRFSQTFARGGVGQAGVEAKPLKAWIDSWQMRGTEATEDLTIAPLDLTASTEDFAYTLHLNADRPLVLQGDGGYSKKSERGQASYYYSQPFFKVTGRITINDKPADVTGRAWMDREWSSEPLAPDQTGWDWFALHLDTSEKLMLYRMRQNDGHHYLTGNWISPDGQTRQLAAADIGITPRTPIEVAGRKLPVQWQIAIPSIGLAIETTPLNSAAWMGTSFPYWEGPIDFHGSHTGVGYLEMTGY